MARIKPVIMPGEAIGTSTRSRVWNLVAPRASEPSRMPRGIARNASSVETITTGTVSSPKVRLAQRMPPVPKVGVPAATRSGKHHWSSSAADAVDKEPQTKNAVDDRGDAGQIVHRDPHDADQQAFFGVFAQVDAGQHAQREAGHGHQEDQHDCAENGRKQAALGVRLARVVPQQLAQLAQVVPALGQTSHRVGLVEAHDVDQRDGRLAPPRCGRRTTFRRSWANRCCCWATKRSDCCLICWPRAWTCGDLVVRVRRSAVTFGRSSCLLRLLKLPGRARATRRRCGEVPPPIFAARRQRRGKSLPGGSVRRTASRRAPRRA